MNSVSPAFVQHVLKLYEKIPEYFDVLSTDALALGNEVLATFFGEVVLGLGNPALTVSTGKGGAREAVTDADILVLRDMGVVHPDVAAVNEKRAQMYAAVTFAFQNKLAFLCVNEYLPSEFIDTFVTVSK